MKFYLGTHRAYWLRTVDVPLFVSHRQLAQYRTLPQAAGSWALDSGGFTELSMYGEWRTTPHEYVAAVRRYRDEVGRLDWAAPQDWMVEDMMLKRTGLTVADHQAHTVDNYVTLRTLDAGLPIVPVIQGQTLDDYRRHIDAYDTAGIDLHAEPTVGIGSVCRRQATTEITTLVANLTATGLRLHGFGMKVSGLRRVGRWMHSADSMAWSFAGRKRGLATCTHARCNNCLAWALHWRAEVLASVDAEPAQLSLGGAA